MTSAYAFLCALRRLDVKVWAEDGRLRCSAPEGTLTTALKNELTRRKDELLSVLAQSDAPQPQQAPPIPAADRNGTLPPSFGQRRLWFLERMTPGTAIYNITSALHLRGPLLPAALLQSLDAVVRRHEVLRTRFALIDGEVVQVIGPAYAPCEGVEDVSHVPASERDGWLAAAAQQERLREFDLANDSPLRARLLRVADEEHVLIVTVHHIAADGWSLGVLRRELASLYRGFAGGSPIELPALPIQYVDFAAWQRQSLAAHALEPQIEYWKAQLEGYAGVLELPTARPRPAVQTYNGAVSSFRCPKPVLDQLRAVSQREHVTLFMTLLAVWALLLERYTGRDDVAVGSPISGRNRRDIEDLVGFFVNSLVLRVDLSGNPTFAQLLGRVKALTLDAYAHQDVPFEKLVEELKPQRDLSRPPLFQIEFVLHDDRDQAFELTGLAVSPIAESPAIAAKLDLSIELTPGEQGLAGVMIYNRDLFSADAMTRLGGHFTELLRSAANRPEARIAELAMLPDDERAQLVSGCNETHVDYGVAQGLHEMVEAQAARTPDAIAIVFEGEALSYDAMNRRANQLAHYLRTLGVGPESLVGICMDRSFEMVIGLLGILKAGGAYVPFDPSYPAERLSYMFEDAGCRVLLTEEHRLRDLPANAATTVCLDRDCDRLAAMPADNPVSGATADNLAYMIYTSGSTGRPKGAMNSHRGVWNRLRWMQQQYGLASDDRVLQKTPFSFDVSVWEFFWPLAVGARLVVAKPGGHQDRTYLAELIAREAITTVHFVPSMLQVFLDEPQVEQCLGLRRVICSGEALSADLQRRWYERMPVPLHNLYGPTEAAVDVTYWECVPGDTRSTVPIGRPVANTQMYVLDDHLAPVPVGVDGELYIGGVQVGRGYLNRAALTAERFIPDPFSAKGARLYRTGDIARRAADGTIEYVGRADHQVKVRGFRIELGEIESVLQEQAAVQQAVVMVREDVAGDPRLVAYVLSPAADSGLVGELRALVASRLPRYMQPSAYVILDALPLSPNGKVDRRALPAPDGRRHLEEPAAAPRNELEEQIAAVWREVLRVPDLGIYDNFFDLGGHSLLATQLTTRLQRALGVELRLTAVFQAPTVAAMADLVLEQLLMEQGTDGAELLLGEIQRLVP